MELRHEEVRAILQRFQPVEVFACEERDEDGWPSLRIETRTSGAFRAFGVRLHPVRYRQLEGEVARWSLLSRGIAERRLLVLDVPSISDGLTALLAQRLRAWAPDAACLLVTSTEGLWWGLSDGPEAPRSIRPQQATPAPVIALPSPPERPDVWSDAAALLAKRIVYHLTQQSPPAVAQGDSSLLRNAVTLAQGCGVAPATAYAFVHRAQHAGWLRKSPREIEVIALPLLLDSWMEFWRAHADSSLPLQWMGGRLTDPSTTLRFLNRISASFREQLAVGGWTAAALSHSSVRADYPLASFHWLGDPRQLAETVTREGFASVASVRDAHFVLRIPRFPRSVRELTRPLPNEAATPIHRIVDPLQIAADVIGQPRGEDQAAHIHAQLVSQVADVRRKGAP